MAHEQTIIPEHPSIDTSGRFATDQLLRSLRYTIHSRKKGQEPYWIKRGAGHSPEIGAKPMKQSEVLKRLPKGILEDAKYAEDLYLDGKYLR
jgi:hypothetical protein